MSDAPERKPLSQWGVRELARATGISPTTVIRVKRGDGDFDLTTMKAILAATGQCMCCNAALDAEKARADRLQQALADAMNEHDAEMARAAAAEAELTAAKHECYAIGDSFRRTSKYLAIETHHAEDAEDRVIFHMARADAAEAELRMANASNRGLVRLNEATQLRAEGAEAALKTAREDALREAADLINARGVREQWNCGLGPETQNFYRARDIVRALISKDQK